MKIVQLSTDTYKQSGDLLFSLGLDSREEIDHHLDEMSQYYVALEGDKVVGVVGWYQDNVNYAKAAMKDSFPGEDAYWVGFFGVDIHFQNIGVGTELLNYLENILLGMKVSELWVSSVPDATGYYQKNGFSIITRGVINDSEKVFLKKDLHREL